MRASKEVYAPGGILCTERKHYTIGTFFPCASSYFYDATILFGQEIEFNPEKMIGWFR
jgi:hypothetical protein